MSFQAATRIIWGAGMWTSRKISRQRDIEVFISLKKRFASSTFFTQPNFPRLGSFPFFGHPSFYRLSTHGKKRTFSGNLSFLLSFHGDGTKTRWSSLFFSLSFSHTRGRHSGRSNAKFNASVALLWRYLPPRKNASSPPCWRYMPRRWLAANPCLSALLTAGYVKGATESAWSGKSFAKHFTQMRRKIAEFIRIGFKTALNGYT